MPNYSFNLKKRRASHKDYDFHKTHKLGAVQLPDELLYLSPILSQDAENCTAFSAVAVRANEIGDTVVNFDPQVFWNDELAFANDKTSQGYNLEVPLAVGVKVGFSPMGNPTLRQNNASAYFWISPGNGLDMFDSIRMAIATNKRPCQAGMDWFYEYNNSPYIKSVGQILNGGHALKIAGWTTFFGEPYLVLQNSWGEQVGLKGLFYMSRTMANKAFSHYGVAYWSDSQDFQIKTLGRILSLWINIKTLLHL